MGLFGCVKALQIGLLYVLWSDLGFFFVDFSIRRCAVVALAGANCDANPGKKASWRYLSYEVSTSTSTCQSYCRTHPYTHSFIESSIKITIFLLRELACF